MAEAMELPEKPVIIATPQDRGGRRFGVWLTVKAHWSEAKATEMARRMAEACRVVAAEVW